MTIDIQNPADADATVYLDGLRVTSWRRASDDEGWVICSYNNGPEETLRGSVVINRADE